MIQLTGINKTEQKKYCRTCQRTHEIKHYEPDNTTDDGFSDVCDECKFDIDNKKGNVKGIRKQQTSNGDLIKDFKNLRNLITNSRRTLAPLQLSKKTETLLFETDTTLTEIKESPEGRVALEELEKKLFRWMLIQSTGYWYKETKTTFYFKKQKDGLRKWSRWRKDVLEKYQPCNFSIFLMVLINLYPEDWKISKEIVSKVEMYDRTPGQRIRKQIESLARDVFATNTDESGGESGVQGGLARVSGECDQTGQK